MYSEQTIKNVKQSDVNMAIILNLLYLLYILTVIGTWIYSFTFDFMPLWFSIICGIIIIPFIIRFGYSHAVTTQLLLFAIIGSIFYNEIFDVIFANFLNMWIFFALFIPDITGLLFSKFETEEMAKERIDILGINE